MRYVATLAFKEGEAYVALVQKNTEKLPHLNGKWNGIGGKMEVGESPVGAAMREFYEETGIPVFKDSMVFVEHQRFPGGVALDDERYCQGDEIYWYATQIDDWSGAFPPLPKVNDVGENLRWAAVLPLLGVGYKTYPHTILGKHLCPNLGYLIPKAITFLRTPYLDRPC